MERYYFSLAAPRQRRLRPRDRWLCVGLRDCIWSFSFFFGKQQSTEPGRAEPFAAQLRAGRGVRGETDWSYWGRPALSPLLFAVGQIDLNSTISSCYRPLELFWRVCYGPAHPFWNISSKGQQHCEHYLCIYFSAVEGLCSVYMRCLGTQ